MYVNSYVTPRKVLLRPFQFCCILLRTMILFDKCFRKGLISVRHAARCSLISRVTVVKHGIQGGGNLMETAPESANHDLRIFEIRSSWICCFMMLIFHCILHLSKGANSIHRYTYIYNYIIVYLHLFIYISTITWIYEDRTMFTLSWSMFNPKPCLTLSIGLNCLPTT